MRINVAVPEAFVGPEVLDAALEGVTRLNEALLADGKVPLFEQAVDRVRWKPEPPGDEHFDHAGVVLGRGWGDCDDLAPWHAASLRASGKDPGATAVVKRSGNKRWHAVVQRSDGRIDDPSAAAGMHEYARAHGIVGAGLPSMFPAEYHQHAYHSHVQGHNVGTFLMRPQLAMRPVRSPYGRIPEAWQARADIPWHWTPGDSKTDVAMVSLHASPVSSQSVVGACRGAVALGEANDVDEDILDRIDCIADACEGVPWEDLADEYGPEHAMAAGALVSGFFGLDKVFKAVTKPLASVIKAPLSMASQIPGVSNVMRMASPLLQQALPIASAALPFAFPGMGSLASMALQTASPMLQQALQQGSPVPPPAQGAFGSLAQRIMQQPGAAAAQAPRAFSFPGMPPGMPFGGGGGFNPFAAFGGRGVFPFG